MCIQCLYIANILLIKTCHKIKKKASDLEWIKWVVITKKPTIVQFHTRESLKNRWQSGISWLDWLG